MNEPYGAQEDRANVDRVLAGDIAAFEPIVRRWQGPLVNLAWRFYRDRGRSEEMAQEAFLRAYRNLGQWRRESAFSTWLFALAANVYRSELNRIPAVMLSLDDIAEPADLRISNTLEAAKQCESIRHAVLALPEKYAMPFSCTTSMNRTYRQLRRPWAFRKEPSRRGSFEAESCCAGSFLKLRAARELPMQPRRLQRRHDEPLHRRRVRFCAEYEK